MHGAEQVRPRFQRECDEDAGFGMVMLEGEKRMQEATRLFEAAAASEPLDAAERLDVDMAKAELED